MKILRRPTRRLWPLVAATVVLVITSCLSGAPPMATASVALPLIPAPHSWLPAPGTWWPGGLAVVRVEPDGPAWQALAAQAETWLGLTPGGDSDEDATLLIVRHGGEGPESYTLDFTPSEVILAAGEPAGAFRGLMTLTQLARRVPDGELPCGRIEDAPRYGWRGLLLDCGRHFMPVPVIKQVIDALALHRGNVLHWHLTEDQGWRLEVPGLPELTEVSAWREGIDGRRVGGYYSTEDVREVVAYAAARHVMVVPEIEMPGHTVAALAAYPELSCTGGPFAVETQWGIHPDIFCAGNDAVFVFLERVLDHVFTLFPGPYVHIGGDEAPKERWRACDRCQERIRREGLADESELQSWFVQRIERYLAQHDRRLIGWDEILEGDLLARSEGATVQSWRSMRGAYIAANASHDAIVSPVSHAYFDYDPGALDVLKVYDFSPVPAGLEDDKIAHILGGEMNLWTEHIPPARVPRMLAPRMAAMAEALWTGSRVGLFPAFLARLQTHGPIWASLGWEPGAAARPLTWRAAYDGSAEAHRFELAIDVRLQELYRADELAVRVREWPRAATPAWRPDIWPEEQPLASDVPDAEVGDGSDVIRPTRPGETAVLRSAQLYVKGAPYGAPAVLELDPHLGLGADVAWDRPASSRYPGGGVGWPTDGRLGGPRHDDGRWAGFESTDLVATVDLERPVALSRLSVRFLQNTSAWIFLPSEVRFAWSADGSTWHDLPALTHDVPVKEQRRLVHEFATEVMATARYIRVQGVSHRICPAWHPGAGRACWIFADEIVIR